MRPHDEHYMFRASLRKGTPANYRKATDQRCCKICAARRSHRSGKKVYCVTRHVFIKDDMTCSVWQP